MKRKCLKIKPRIHLRSITSRIITSPLVSHPKHFAVQRRILPPDHPDIALSLNNIAMSYHSLGESPKRIKLLQESLAIRQKAFPPDHPDIVQSLNNIALCYCSLGEPSKAIPLYSETLTIWRSAIQRRILPPDHPDIALSQSNIVLCYKALRGSESDTISHQNCACPCCCRCGLFLAVLNT